MKLRSTLLLLPVVGGLFLGTLAPAEAATTGPVTDVAATAAQTPGAHDRWTITTTWAEDGATRYSVVIADQETGGVVYASKAASHSPVSLTTDALIGDHDFWVRVQPEGGDAVASSFHTPALDTTPPTGRYKLDRTSGYLTEPDMLSAEPASAVFVITQTAAVGAATRSIVAGDGTPAQAWRSGDGFVLSYTKAGVYTPHVLLSDEFANVTDVALPAVRVLEDETPPVVTVTAPAKPGRAASWRTIRGTASDAGTGVIMLAVMVMERRGTVWWTYDFSKLTWVKGFTSRHKTEAKSKASPALLEPPASGAWRTPAIRHLEKGVLHVEAAALDAEFNIGVAKPVNHRVR